MPESYNQLIIKNTIEDFQKGKRESAFKILKDFVLKNPNHSLANYNLALMAQELKKFEEAKDNYLRAIKSDQKNWQAKFNLYLLLIKEKKYDEALLLVNSVLLIKKNYQPALRDKALILNYLYKPEEGLRYILKSIEINNVPINACYF